MSNNISKNFKDSEIRGVMEIDGKKVLYLKEGVTKLKYNDSLSDTDMDHINPVVVFLERYGEVMTKLYGDNDPDENN